MTDKISAALNSGQAGQQPAVPCPAHVQTDKELLPLGASRSSAPEQPPALEPGLRVELPL